MASRVHEQHVASVDVGVKTNIGARERRQDHGLTCSRRAPCPRTNGRPAARPHRRFRRLQNSPSPADLAFQSRLERQRPPFENHAHTVSPEKPTAVLQLSWHPSAGATDTATGATGATDTTCRAHGQLVAGPLHIAARMRRGERPVTGHGGRQHTQHSRKLFFRQAWVAL
jgi:hypothetical protein